MKKYVIKGTEEKVEMGDVFTLKIKLMADEESLQWLEKAGLVEAVKKDEEELSVGKAIAHLAKRLKWKEENVAKYLDKLHLINPFIAASVVLREIAIMLDEKYPDHISKCERVCVINTFDRTIQVVRADFIKDFRCCACFRTFSDARKALKVMSDIFDDLYGGEGEQEDKECH